MLDANDISAWFEQKQNEQFQRLFEKHPEILQHPKLVCHDVYECANGAKRHEITYCGRAIAVWFEKCEDDFENYKFQYSVSEIEIFD